MKLGIINIGDELLIGQIVNTNAQWMSKKMTEAGFEVFECITIADNAEQIKESITYLFAQVDAILMTGGLGPTKDDITKKTLCEYYETELVYSQEVLENIESLWRNRGYPVNELTKTQALIPKDAIIIQNKVGTAPIMYFERNNKILVSLPGVPFEMKYNVENEIITLLKKTYSSEAYISKNILVKGFSESALAQHLAILEDKLPSNIHLAYLPSPRLVKLRLFVRGDNNLQKFEEEYYKLKNLLNQHIVAEEDIPLQQILASKLESMNLSLGTAESCTGGNLSHLITLQPGASAYFKGAVIAYCNDMKTEILGVKKETIERKGVVSVEVVEEMAQGLQRLLHVNCAIAISGIAGPNGGTPDVPVGTVCICTRMNNIQYSECYQFGNYREANIVAASNTAIIQLLEMLENNNA